MIFDDSIIEKPYTNEGELVCWHYDHSKGKSVKGINILSAFYHSCDDSLPEPIRLPIMYQLILKTITYSVVKTKKTKRKSETTKNAMMLEIIAQAIHNQLKFKYVLVDSWFASASNMRFIKKKKKFFIPIVIRIDMKSNRNAVLNQKDRNKGQWSRIDKLDVPDNTSVKVWLKDLEFPVLLTKQIFKNKDQSTGVRFLVSNVPIAIGISLSDDQFTTIYKKRWSVEEYHKSLKQNAAIAKSPTRTTRTQSNHIFASIVAYIKLEKLKMVNEINHFAMKSKLYLSALKAVFKELTILKDSSFA